MSYEKDKMLFWIMHLNLRIDSCQYTASSCMHFFIPIVQNLSSCVFNENSIIQYETTLHIIKKKERKKVNTEAHKQSCV